MLSLREAPARQCFATLPLALDPARAGAAIARALSAHGFPTSGLSVDVERVRLKPGRKALIGYRLRGRDARGQLFNQQLMLTLWPYGDFTRLPAMGGEASAEPAFGPAFMEVAELGGEAWFFPNDRKIRHLPDLLEQARAMGGEAEVIHYVPEQGCTVRAVVDGEVRYGKARADERGSVSVRVRETAAPALDGRVRLAPILCQDAARRIQWQGEVAGSPLAIDDIALEPLIWANRIAQALAAFHALPEADGLKLLDQPSICNTVLGRIERIAPAMPEHADALTQIAARLERLCTGSQPLRLSHGDLHPANLLWDGTSFALIDLDTCALAPPALDQGSLAASLAAKAIQLGWETRHIGSLIDVLAIAFKDEGAAQFDWFVAASLIGERLYRSATRLKSANPAARLALLKLAEDRLDRLEHAHVR